MPAGGHTHSIDYHGDCSSYGVTQDVRVGEERQYLQSAVALKGWYMMEEEA